jgi:hypothetical protein
VLVSEQEVPLSQLRKRLVKKLPFSGPHDVVVQLLVEVVEEGDGLNDHGVDLVGAELQLVARQRMSETQRHCGHVFVLMKKGFKLASNTIMWHDLIIRALKKH